MWHPTRSSRPNRSGAGRQSTSTGTVVTATELDPSLAPEPSAARERPRSVDLVDVGLAVALLVLAAWLRAGPLGPSSLWLDDAWVAVVHRVESLEELRWVGLSAPGFVLLLRAWLAVAGFSETAAQLPILVAGVLTPVTAYVVARRVGWHRSSALVGAVLLATSPVAITYATRVKQYAVESLLGVLLLALGWWLLADVRSTRRWVVVVVVGAAATVVSTFLALYVGAAALAALLVAFRERDGVAARRGLAACAAFGLAAIAWYVAVLAPVVSSSVRGFWSGRYLEVGDGIGPAITSLRTAAVGVADGFSDLPTLMILIVAAVAAAALLWYRAEVAVLLLAPTFAAVVLAAMQLAPLGGGRTDTYLYPSLALLIGGGVEVLADRFTHPRVSILAVTAAAAVGTASLVVATPATDYPAQDARPLVAQLDQARAPDDQVLVYPATMWAYALYTDREVSFEPDEASSWGFAPTFADPAVAVLPPGRDAPEVYLPTVERLTAGGQRIWLLATHWRDDLFVLEDQLRDRGYERSYLDRRDGARLDAWDPAG